MVENEPVYRCYKCKEELVFDVKIGRRDMCPNCYSYLHCCYNCKFWDPKVHNQCTENQGEFIRDRAEGNFCLYFTFRSSEEADPSEEEEAKERLKSLFGDRGRKDQPKTSPKSAEDAKSRLEALFKKK